MTASRSKPPPASSSHSPPNTTTKPATTTPLANEMPTKKQAIAGNFKDTANNRCGFFVSTDKLITSGHPSVRSVHRSVFSSKPCSRSRPRRWKKFDESEIEKYQPPKNEWQFADVHGIWRHDAAVVCSPDFGHLAVPVVAVAARCGRTRLSRPDAPPLASAI